MEENLIIEKDVSSAPDESVEADKNQATPLPPKKDRRGRIKAMGVMQIILGALCCLFLLFALLGVLIGRTASSHIEGAPAANPGLASLGIYAIAAAFFFIIGIGSINLRRWVRPIVLSFMWPALFFGVGMFLAGLFVFPSLFDAMAVSPGANPGFQRTVFSAVKTVMVVLFFVTGVVIPGVHLLIYHPAAARDTLAAYDKPRRFWDKCPTPIIGIAVSLISIGVMQLMSLGVGIVAFFGLVLTGGWAAALIIAELIVCAVLAYLVLGSKLAGLKGSFVFLIYLCVRNAVTFWLIDFAEILKKTGNFPPNVEEMTGDLLSGLNLGPIAAVFWLIAGLSAAGYLWYAKKYFHQPS
jgi:hypothetical protein